MEDSAKVGVQIVKRQDFPRIIGDFSRSALDVEESSSESTERGTPRAAEESSYIRNLVWIKTDSVASALHEDLENTIAVFEPRVTRTREQIRKTQDEILRLVASYCVLQGVLLAFVAFSNVLKCSRLWTPFTLSALSSFITFRGVFQKYRIIESLEEVLSVEDRALKVAVAKIYKLKQKGPEYFDSCNQRGEYMNGRARSTVDIFVVLPLVSFSVVVLASFWQMLCRP